MKNKVTLQINLAPGDFLHARYILKHQLKTLAQQVDEILLVIDTRPAKGRFAEGWYRYQQQFQDFLSVDIAAAFEVKVVAVDYSETVKRKIGQSFFSTAILPDHDFRGGPFHVYFFGLWQARNELVFHLDSDILLGGGSQTWVSEAVALFRRDPQCFVVSPLPGPPHPSDTIKGQHIQQKIAPFTYQFAGMSTRLFMIDKSKFAQQKLLPGKPAFRNQLKAIIEGNTNADLPEHIISNYMQLHQLKRIDFLGEGSGMWSLHPPYRTASFYKQLPDLIRCTVSNDFPLAQRGFYDIVDEVCDWTEAREKLKNNRWWKRLLH